VKKRLSLPRSSDEKRKGEKETVMTTTPQPLVVAAFPDRSQAEQAITQLRNAGFRDDQVRYWVGASSGGFLETVKSAFSGQEGTSSRVYDDLTGTGMPEADASFFQSEADSGRTIVAVLAPDRPQEAVSILASYGGYGTGASARQTVDTTSTAASTAYGAATAAGEQALTDTDETHRLQLREEQLRAQKQRVQTGEVRLGKEVVTEEKTINVPTTREEVYIERRPGSGQPADEPIREGETIEVPVSEERVTVEKQPVVREEVGLGKRQVQEEKQVTDTVRREEARLEREGDIKVRGDSGEITTDRDTTT
jgi:uncharacterized protein (TIGR02271 family)